MVESFSTLYISCKDPATIQKFQQILYQAQCPKLSKFYQKDTLMSLEAQILHKYVYPHVECIP